jgi:hypothetical protein
MTESAIGILSVGLDNAFAILRKITHFAVDSHVCGILSEL